MDVLEMIKGDHDRINSLFKDAQTPRDENRKWQMIRTLRTELDRYLYAEETVFLPVFRKFSEFKDPLDLAYRELGEMRTILTELTRTPRGGTNQISEKIQQLGSIFENHAKEEETEIFPLVRKVMKRAERDQLGRHIQKAKQERAEAA